MWNVSYQTTQSGSLGVDDETFHHDQIHLIHRRLFFIGGYLSFYLANVKVCRVSASALHGALIQRCSPHSPTTSARSWMRSERKTACRVKSLYFFWPLIKDIFGPKQSWWLLEEWTDEQRRFWWVWHVFVSSLNEVCFLRS